MALSASSGGGYDSSTPSSDYYTSDSEASSSASTEERVEPLNVEDPPGKQSSPTEAPASATTSKLASLLSLDSALIANECLAGFLANSSLIFIGYTLYHGVLQTTGVALSSVLSALALLVLPGPLLFFRVLKVANLASGRSTRMLVRLPSLVLMPLSAAFDIFYLRMFLSWLAVWSVLLGMYGASSVTAQFRDGSATVFDRVDSVMYHRRYWLGFVTGHVLVFVLRLLVFSLDPMVYSTIWAIAATFLAIEVWGVLFFIDTKRQTHLDVVRDQINATHPLTLRNAVLLDGSTEPIIEKDVEDDLGAESTGARVAYGLATGLWFGTALIALLWIESSPFLFPRWSGVSDVFPASALIAICFILGAMGTHMLVIPPLLSVVLYLAGLLVLGFGTSPASGIVAGAVLGLTFSSHWTTLATALRLSGQHTSLATALTTASIVFVIGAFVLLGLFLGENVPLAGVFFRKPWAVACFFAVLIIIGFVVYFRRSQQRRFKEQTKSKFFKPAAGKHSNPAFFCCSALIVVLFIVASVVGLLQRAYTVDGEVKGSLHVGSWNIFQGQRDANGELNVDDIVAKLDALKLNVIGFQESDAMHFVTGNRDVVEAISVGWKSSQFYGLPTREGSVGCAIIAKHSLRATQADIMPSEDATTLVRPLVRSTLRFDGADVVFFNTHVEFSSEEDAMLQIRYISDEVNAVAGPVIVVGDFNFQPNSTVIKTFVELTRVEEASDVMDDSWNMTAGNPPPTYRDGSKIDYIFFRDLRVINAGYPDSGESSDHFMLVAEFSLMI